MEIFNWFSAGSSRKNQTLLLINALIVELKNSNSHLLSTLKYYRNEIQTSEKSISLILSRMNIDIEHAIKLDGSTLNSGQLSQIQQLLDISKHK